MFKNFFSGIFAGMANDQAKRGDYAGTKWRADMALRCASTPYSLACAHAVSAKAYLLGNKRVAARDHMVRALSLIESAPEIHEFEEINILKTELLAMQHDLGH